MYSIRLSRPCTGYHPGCELMTLWTCVLQEQSSFSSTHLPAHSTDRSGFPQPISSHPYQPLAQSESQNLPSQHPPQASIPSSEPSFFPSIGSQVPSQHAGGMGGLGDGMTNGFGSLSGLPDAQHNGGPLLNGAAGYSLGPDPSSIPQPGQLKHCTSLTTVLELFASCRRGCTQDSQLACRIKSWRTQSQMRLLTEVF